MRNSFILFLSLVYLAGCASNSPPSTTTDVCKIFKERYSWYKAAKKTEEINQESWDDVIPLFKKPPFASGTLICKNIDPITLTSQPNNNPPKHFHIIFFIQI